MGLGPRDMPEVDQHEGFVMPRIDMRSFLLGFLVGLTLWAIIMTAVGVQF